ncbi:MAG: SPOR domain-containing protein [Bacteroidales bacterium]|nr:SPOR domain-containing protein [Bacteroidales bacterium]
MTGIDKYISELLFDHDCVILPGFGGFLTNYSGARIHPVRHSFQPPARTVIFNANLSTNDGLLIDYVCRSEGIAYKEASAKVNAYVMQCIRELEAGSTVLFNNIGSCRMGKEKNKIFEPDTSSNYLADAFGLPSFVSPAIRRESVRERLEKQLTPRPVAPREKKKINRRPVIGWAAGISIPVAAALLLYFYSPAIINTLDNSYASFVPTIKFAKTKHHPAELTPKTASSNNFRVIPETVAEEPLTSHEAPAYAVAEPENLRTRYQIVVGAFSEQSNASTFVDELRSKNYDAAITGESKGGLTRVSINGSDQKNEALNILAQIRNNINPNAWLLRIR